MLGFLDFFDDDRWVLSHVFVFELGGFKLTNNKSIMQFHHRGG